MPIAKAATNVQLASLANRLRLTLIRDRMTEFLCMATEKKLTPRETLEYFFTQEILRREENRILQGIMGAHFPMVRTLEGFSQTEQSAIDPRVLRELAQLEWLEQAQNVIFFGPPREPGKLIWPLASDEPPLQPAIKSLSTARIISSRSWNKP